MKRNKRHQRRAGLQLFEGNVWTMPSLAVARSVYHALLKQFLDKNPAEWSLVSGFFQQQPVLAVLWDPTRNAEMAKTVERAALHAGGQELEETAKSTLLSQLLTRRVGLQAKEGPFDTLTAHHPKGKPAWDLKDWREAAMAKARFLLGQLVATPGALQALQEAGQDALEFLSRHQHGDWGELSDEDKRENEFSVTRHLRILSAYTLTTGVKIWLITEADRSSTTILLPEEY